MNPFSFSKLKTRKNEGKVFYPGAVERQGSNIKMPKKSWPKTSYSCDDEGIRELSS